jgi:hypothetical protein
MHLLRELCVNKIESNGKKRILKEARLLNDGGAADGSVQQ